ncbi:hypothetical protein KPL78_12625 [Roseomonas sp. HJA6]|uniref:DUF4136 domain-containing protein n=1 Tax=Roseomonas alba TaxID=2846776 RepID=A0ABS7A9D0_9PROT|nr:hypothetical protein [Neoroseomonas alba]MBW6398700.1 hypothetical protein [Neoroseomonas alba]
MIGHLPHLVLLTLTGLLTACGVPDVTDLRLDGLSPPHIVNLRPEFMTPDPRFIRAAIVAELSTSRDLRELATNHAIGTNAYVVLCYGRSHIIREERRFDVVLIDRLRDELEVVSNRRPRSDWPPPIDGRYRYSVAIGLRQQGREDRSDGRLEYSLAELDLMRDPVDLCLVVDTVGYAPRWRSNTVMIPPTAIRAAVATGTPP